MKSIAEQIALYGAYHQDKRNVATHFLGIPMIVFGIAILLSRPAYEFLDISITPVLIMVTVLSIYYIFLDLRFGLAMAILLLIALIFAHQFALKNTMEWLGWGAGLFIIGWILQFIGHIFEGKKPAFFDDIVGLVIGPLFLVVECAFALGWRQDLQEEVNTISQPHS